MNDAVNVWMRLEDFVEVFLFSDVNLEEFGSLSADEFDTIYSFVGRVEEVVYDDDFVVCFE